MKNLVKLALLLLQTQAQNLPALGASKEYVITAGYSSGAETSSHLMLAFPEIFGCAGILNGGFPLTLQRTQRENEEDYLTYNSDREDYNILVGEINEMVHLGLLGDQTQLKKLNRAAYIFTGEEDEVVPPWASKEIKRYFENKGVKVKYESDPDMDHTYQEETAASDIGIFCYYQMGAGVTLRNYKPEGSEYKDKGVFKKFDQLELAKRLYIRVPELSQFGYYYFPKACENKSCKLQLTIHGCGGTAVDIASDFGNYAAANDIIMVFPQAKECFMGDVGDDRKAALNQIARDRGMMKFMKGIVDRVTSPRAFKGLPSFLKKYYSETDSDF